MRERTGKIRTYSGGVVAHEGCAPEGAEPVGGDHPAWAVCSRRKFEIALAARWGDRLTRSLLEEMDHPEDVP